ncbi:MAG: hypothetical protein H6Q33_2705, partial [Deltaproteobacteria bacterium]|nr:hypothetical protein [Deltaproteobacteria bacterium]
RTDRNLPTRRSLPGQHERLQHECTIGFPSRVGLYTLG